MIDHPIAPETSDDRDLDDDIIDLDRPVSTGDAPASERPTFGFLVRAEARERQRNELIELLFAPLREPSAGAAGHRTSLFPPEARVVANEVRPNKPIFTSRPAVAPLDLTKIQFGSDEVSEPTEVLFVSAAPTSGASLFWPIIGGLLAAGLALLAINLLWPLTG